MVRGSEAVNVEVQPLPHLPSTRLGEGSSSAGVQHDIAYTTNVVFDKLVGSSAQHVELEDSIYIVIQWPDERRIAGKGKSRSLVIQVRRPPDDLVGQTPPWKLAMNKLISQRHDPKCEMLYVPLQLLPRYPDVPLRATIRLHRPVELSQMILQSLSYDDELPEIDDLDLRSLISGEARSEAQSKGRSNGLVNGNGHHIPEPFRIFREGHNVLIPTTSAVHPLPFRILMLEPVAQGYLTPDTKVILSTIPYDPDPDDDDGDAEGSIYGQSSHGKTHLSMADFDPDTFLSSSLALALHSSSVNGEDVDGEVEQSVSSTSGSITPRPPGAMFRPSSPPARPLDLEDLDGMDADTAGTRFGAVVANGAAGTQDDVCWVSVGGLGRAGIFEGDWVSSSWRGEYVLMNRFC
jgi:peroxin-6